MRRPDRTILWIKLAFVALFAVICAGMWWYELRVQRPMQLCRQTPGAVWFPKTRSCHVPENVACEQGGGWWEPQSRTCARVINIPELTRRMSASRPPPRQP